MRRHGNVQAVVIAGLLTACGGDDDDKTGLTAPLAPIDAATGPSVGPEAIAADAGVGGGDVAVGSAALDGEQLVVSDPSEKRLFVYAVPSFQLIADIRDVAVADHPGFLPLPDGRLLFVDAEGNQLRVARIGGVATPGIERSIPLMGSPAHIAVDPEGSHAMVSASSGNDDGRGFLSLITLADGNVVHVPIATGEPGVALIGNPPSVIHRNDTPPRFELHDREALRAGSVTPRAVAPIGDGPHGEVIAHTRGLVASATATGVSVASVGAQGFGPVTTIPYDVDGITGGRAFYARLSGDGRYLYSYLRDDAGGTAKWSAFRNDLYVVDLETKTAKRMPVGNGLVYRLGVCPRLAAFTQYAPGGDFLYVLDADASSPTLHDVIARVPLAPMSKAPGPDGDVWDSDAFRITALSSDCAHAFVTHGGDGKISVIDTKSATVTRVLDVPTPLAHGGYLVSMRAGAALIDTIGR